MTDARTSPFYYNAFGLTIASDFELPELSEAAPGAAALTIRRRAIDHPALATMRNTAIDFKGDQQLLAWETVGAFLVSHEENRIDVDPVPGLDPRLLSFPLLGPVLATYLHYGGCFVLHASAVSVNGEGVVLLGDKGAGKSTTASALVTAGHTLLSDDVVAIRFCPDGPPLIQPAFGQVKLTESAAEVMSLDADVQNQVHPSIDKLMHRLRSGFSAEPREPRTFYVLERGGDARYVPLESVDALPALIRFSYAIRFGQAALQPQHAARHLKQSAAMVSHANVGRLVVPSNLTRLGEAVQLLESLHPGTRETKV